MNDKPLDLIINQLKTYDETEICDLLQITSEDLLTRFRHKILARREFLESELEIFPTQGEVPDEKEYEHGYQELDFND